MKRKVLVLTMGVICATQLWHSNHANALVNILRLAMKKSMTIDFFIAIFYSYREE